MTAWSLEPTRVTLGCFSSWVAFAVLGHYSFALWTFVQLVLQHLSNEVRSSINTSDLAPQSHVPSHNIVSAMFDREFGKHLSISYFFLSSSFFLPIILVNLGFHCPKFVTTLWDLFDIFWQTLIWSYSKCSQWFVPPLYFHLWHLNLQEWFRLG